MGSQDLKSISTAAIRGFILPIIIPSAKANISGRQRGAGVAMRDIDNRESR